jgi:hypothetical protein
VRHRDHSLENTWAWPINPASNLRINARSLIVVVPLLFRSRRRLQNG